MPPGSGSAGVRPWTGLAALFRGQPPVDLVSALLRRVTGRHGSGAPHHPAPVLLPGGASEDQGAGHGALGDGPIGRPRGGRRGNLIRRPRGSRGLQAGARRAAHSLGEQVSFLCVSWFCWARDGLGTTGCTEATVGLVGLTSLLPASENDTPRWFSNL